MHLRGVTAGGGSLGRLAESCTAAPSPVGDAGATAALGRTGAAAMANAAAVCGRLTAVTQAGSAAGSGGRCIEGGAGRHPAVAAGQSCSDVAAVPNANAGQRRP